MGSRQILMKASTPKTEMTVTTRSGSDVRAETSVDTKLKLKLRRLHLQQLIGEKFISRNGLERKKIKWQCISKFLYSSCLFTKKLPKNSRPSIYKKIFYGYYLNYDIK